MPHRIMLHFRNAQLRRSCGTAAGLVCGLLLWVISPSLSRAQICLTTEDIEPKTRTALESASQRYFSLAAQGDAAGLRQNTIPSLAADFGGVEAAIKDNQANLAASKGTLRTLFELQATGKEALPRAEFLCGVFGKSGQTANSAVVVLSNLPPGDYALAILDADGKIPLSVSFVLQAVGAEWKVGGFYAKATQVAGRDGQWFLDRARELKAKGKTRSAWLYYLEARDLLSPVPFMSTLTTDKIYDESQALQPNDLPAEGKTVDLAAGGKPYRLTSVFPVGIGSDIDLVVKYESPNVSDATRTYQENVNVIKALVTKYPELRDAFTAVVARATETSGKDYGTLLAMKDIH